MMEFVNDSKVFSKRFEEIKSFIDVERKLPHNLFSNFKEKYYCVFEFDYIFFEQFEKGFTQFISLSKVKGLSILVSDPDPIEVYLKLFNLYPLAIFDHDLQIKDYNDFFLKKFEPSSFDNNVLMSNDICFLPKSKEWAMFCSRGFEVAIFCATTKEIKNQLITSLGFDITLDFSMAYEVGFVKRTLDLTEKVKEKYDLLVKNYIGNDEGE